MASNGRTTTRRWNIGLLILTLRIPEPFLPPSTQMMPRPNSPGGKRVPEAVGLVVSSGVTLHDYQTIFVEFAPALSWLRTMRTNVAVLFLMSIVVNVGMWLERFVIVVISLTRDFMPSAWGRYSPTVWDWATFIGTLGFFTTLIFLFVRVLPAISIAEMRELVAHTSEEHE